MNKAVRIVIVVVVLAAVVWLAWPYAKEYFFPTDDPNTLFTSGVVECTQVDVGSEVTGPITILDVREGDVVKKGDLIARIDADDLMIQLEGAQAAADRARALATDARKGLRPEEIRRLEQMVEIKRAKYEQAEIDYQRKFALAEKEVAPRNPAILAEKAMQAAREDLQQAKQHVEIARMGAREDQVRAAEMALRQAQSQVDQLKKRIADTEVISPLDGRVNIKHKDEGEIAAMGSTLVTVIDLSEPWIRIYIPEPQLGRVELGQSVEIKSDSYPEKTYTGTLRYLSSEAEFTPKNVQTEDERVKLVYAAKVYVDNSHLEFKPGMPVDVYIPLKPRTEKDDGGNN